MKVLQRSEVREPLTTTLPPGDYLVVDPCYVLDATYKQLMDLKWGDGGQGDGNYVLQLENGVMVVWPTIVGDGSFDFSVCKPLIGRDATLPVDSGQLAFINVSCVEKGDIDDCGTLKVVEPLTITIRDNANVDDVDGNLNVLVDAEDGDWDD